MERGYLKLWRCTLDTDIWSNESLWRLWSWCLLKASHKERWFSISTGKGTTEVHLLPGQFVFGRKTAAKELRWTESTIYKRLLKLKTLGNCNIESNTHYSVVTICKWSIYQPVEIQKEQPKEQAGNRQGTGKEHIQECKEGKEENIFVDETHQPMFCPHQKIIESYNKILPSLPRVKAKLWNGTRQKNLQSRWKEDPDRQSVEWWDKLFQSIAKTPFLLGQNKTGWRADLGWIINASNIVKILEGKYKEKEEKW
jgi:hypothetical protein